MINEKEQFEKVEMDIIRFDSAEVFTIGESSEGEEDG